jgi:hypothetical protein
MTMVPDARALPDTGYGVFATLDTDVLGFVADMHGIQLDQLAALLINQGDPAGSAMRRILALGAPGPGRSRFPVPR